MRCGCFCYNVCFLDHISNIKQVITQNLPLEESYCFFNIQKNPWVSGAACFYLKALKMCAVIGGFSCAFCLFFLWPTFAKKLILNPQICRQCAGGDIITSIADLYFEIHSGLKKCAVYCRFYKIPSVSLYVPFQSPCRIQTF